MSLCETRKIFQRVFDSAESVSTIRIAYPPYRVGVVNEGLGVSLCQTRNIVFCSEKKKIPRDFR